MVDPEVKLPKNALTVLEKRHLKKDKNGRVLETPEERLWRVAGGRVCDADVGEVIYQIKEV